MVKLHSLSALTHPYGTLYRNHWMQVNNWKQNKQKIERALDRNTTCVCLGLGSPDEGVCKNYVFGGVGE